MGPPTTPNPFHEHLGLCSSSRLAFYGVGGGRQGQAGLRLIVWVLSTHSQDNNPLYQSAITTTVNPFYQEAEKTPLRR